MEDYVSFEIAKKLKEKGFSGGCSHYYRTKSKDLFMIFPCEDWSDIEERINAPAIPQVLKWMRDVHNLHFEVVGAAYGYNLIISDTPNKGGTDRYYSHAKDDGPNDGGAWDEYEDCVMYGIEYVLDNLI